MVITAYFIGYAAVIVGGSYLMAKYFGEEG